MKSMKSWNSFHIPEQELCEDLKAFVVRSAKDATRRRRCRWVVSGGIGILPDDRYA